jgi:hypothetical protein
VGLFPVHQARNFEIRSDLAEMKVQKKSKETPMESFSVNQKEDYSKLTTFWFNGHSLKMTRDNFLAVFRKMTQLQELQLQYCDIRGTFDIGVLEQMQKLTSFHAVGNFIDTLVNTANHSLPSLKYMDLSWNKLGVLDIETFKTFPGLAEIILNSNRLVKINDFALVPKLLPQIQNISLKQNDLLCSDIVEFEKIGPFWYTQEHWSKEHVENYCRGWKNMVQGLACCYRGEIQQLIGVYAADTITSLRDSLAELLHKANFDFSEIEDTLQQQWQTIGNIQGEISRLGDLNNTGLIMDSLKNISQAVPAVNKEFNEHKDIQTDVTNKQLDAIVHYCESVSKMEKREIVSVSQKLYDIQNFVEET